MQAHRRTDTSKKEPVFIGARVTHGVGLGVVGSAAAVVKREVQGPPRSQEWSP